MDGRGFRCRLRGTYLRCWQAVQIREQTRGIDKGLASELDRANTAGADHLVELGTSEATDDTSLLHRDKRRKRGNDWWRPGTARFAVG